ncbi:hypothetical protein [Rhizobium leguminosarum]
MAQMENTMINDNELMLAGQMRASEFLKTHKIAISFKWRNATYGYYASHEETDAAWAEVLRSEGYVTPKWWQASRWGEKRPPKEVLALLKDNGR